MLMDGLAAGSGPRGVLIPTRDFVSMHVLHKVGIVEVLPRTIWRDGAVTWKCGIRWHTHIFVTSSTWLRIRVCS